ncbi:SBP (S-ribonuclease binding protein) family protein [Trema orientale]|uniref:SBP (S-ribonuclease binding protein) family protein n=1 Tax=Trema orientale TaxID=63057 RepID=A0A2P5F836_TREOI|nr:SBP (S-ribonuclease binding protein) family protein [Trema orientale]
MAAQAHLYSGNMGLSAMCALQDYSLMNPALGVDEDGGLSCFGLQTTQQQTQFHLHQGAQNYSTGFDCNHGVHSPFSSSSSNMFLRMALDAQLELQRQELDSILQSQSEKLKVSLHEQRKHQLSVLMSSFESKTLSMIRQKEEDMARATNRSMELQDRLRKAEMESQTWQRVAKANEATLMDLKNTLEYFRETQQQLALICNNGAQDAESCCERVGENGSDQNRLACKSCKTQSSCVLFFPCRHLCSCKSCEAFLGSCPVCESTKEATLEVFLV